MTPEEMLKEITLRRPVLREVRHEQTIKDILEFAVPLAEETRTEIVKAFKHYYTIEAAPEVSDLIQCAEKAHMQIKKSNTEFYYNVCDICKTSFSLQAGGCPVCRKRTNTSVGSGKPPKGYIQCQEECFGCKHFKRKPQGPTCPEFGRGPYGPMCTDCICKRCCTEKCLQITNPLELRRMKKEGTLEIRREEKPNATGGLK